MAVSSLATVKLPAYSGNYTKGRSKKIEKITIHHCASILSIEQLGNIWKTKGRKGSSHYGIGNDGRIGNYVDENNTAWTDSNWNSNCKSVTIETSNNATGGDWTVSDKALNSLIKLVADIAKRNNLGTLVPGKNLTWHSMYAKTTCPGNYLRSKMQYISDEANKINGGVQPTPKSTSTQQPTSGFLPSKGYFKYGDVSDNIGKVADFMYKNFPAYTPKAILSSKNHFGPSMLSTIKNFQKRTGLVVDGYLGKKTYEKLKSFGFKG